MSSDQSDNVALVVIDMLNLAEAAIEMMERNMEADITTTSDCSFGRAS